MKIGIDLRALQTGDRQRGIGEVTKQITDNVLKLAAKDRNHKVSFIFYEYDDNDPKQFLLIPKSVKYEIVKLGLMPEKKENHFTFQEKLQRNAGLLYGNPIKDSAKSDVFLQYNYSLGVPTNTKTVVFMHDIIPYLFWKQYFESPLHHFRHGAFRAGGWSTFANYKYLHVLKRSLHHADQILAISTNTKNDLIKNFNVNKKKIDVVPLGVSARPSKTNDKDVQQTKKLPTKPYLLFIGAADDRRKLQDLVSAFNNLKAEGQDLQLVLIGENFASFDKLLCNSTSRKAILESSYKKDILLMGYIDDEYKQELYRHALAFVYPTKYEGFGLPILEAMIFDCPIITYNNSSTEEVGGQYALYVKDWVGIKNEVEKILKQTKKTKEKKLKLAKKYAEKFTWQKTAKTVYQDLIKIAKN